jgi:hypothetical protein
MMNRFHTLRSNFNLCRHIVVDTQTAFSAGIGDAKVRRCSLKPVIARTD